MNSHPFYSQINLAPLLDVVFVTLFVVVLSVGKSYKDTAAAEATEFQQTVNRMQESAEVQRARIQQLEADNQDLATQLREAEARADRMEQELITARSALADTEAELVQVQDDLALMEEVASLDEQSYQAALRELQDQVDAAQANEAALTEQVRTLEAQQAVTEEERERLAAQVDEYQAQLSRMATALQSSPDDPIVATIKSEFVDTYISLYTIEIFTSGRGVSRVQLTNSNNRTSEEVVSSPEQVAEFLDDNLDQFDKDRTLILFFKASDSLYEHEQWIEDYLRENDFPFGEWRRE